VHRSLLPGSAQPDDRVTVGIAGEQRRLEEEHAGRPDRRRSAEPGQQQFGEHRLDEKQQQRVHEERCAEEKSHA